MPHYGWKPQIPGMYLKLFLFYFIYILIVVQLWTQKESVLADSKVASQLGFTSRVDPTIQVVFPEQPEWR